MIKGYRHILLIVFSTFIMGGEGLWSQNNGILGRKFIGKVVVANGIQPLHINVEGEYAFHSKMTFSLGFGVNQSMHSQNFYIQGRREYNNITQQFEINNNYYEKKESTKSTKIQSAFVNAQFNFYPYSLLLPAPNGFYLGAKVKAGLASIDSENGFPFLAPVNYTVGTQVAPYRLDYVFFKTFSGGFGVQKLIGSRWTIDGALFFDLTFFNKNGNSDSKLYTSTLAKNYGSNLFHLNSNYRNTRPQSINIDQSMGFSFFLKVGYFIF